jgi:DNA ligase (NAD+)
MNRRDQAHPPLPDMVWSDTYEMWLDKDTRSDAQKQKDEQIAMNVENIKSDKLEALLRKASDAYYNDTPIMSDKEFDDLCAALASIDPNNKFIKEIGAPVVVGVWPKIKHKYVMGSQDKVKTKEDFLKWAANKSELVITDKLDGSTLVLTYKDGRLVSAATRGDGIEGEEIFDNAIKMQNVKEHIEGFSGVLRGEMILEKSAFDTIFKPLGYKNPRNAANGIAREKVSAVLCLVQNIMVIYFDVIAEIKPRGQEIAMLSTEIEKENFVRKAGLKYVYIRGPYNNPEDAWKQFEIRVSQRPTLGYEVDGMVVKMNDLPKQAQLGDLNGRPRGQIAIKYEAQSKETTVLDIQWQVGQNGRISPVAIVEPTDIGGVTIARCTLNNKDYIKALGVSVGSKVTLTRFNDVIPGISASIAPGTGATNAPTTCPICSGKLESEGAYIFCPMIDCQGKTIGALNAWIKATKLKGVGPAVLSGLIDLGIDNPYKLVTADRENFHDACKGEKNGDKVYQQVMSATNMDLATFLYALNVPHVGEINARRIAKHFGTIQAIMTATVDDLALVPGIKTTSDEIKQSLIEKTQLINNLIGHVQINGTSGIGPLSGHSFCVTGELWAGREEIQDLMRSKGAEVKNSVSKDLTFLVTDDPNSGTSKNKKAQQYGVKIINGNTLKALLEDQIKVEAIK